MANPGKFTLAINTICDRNINSIKNNTTDNIQFIQEWKKRLHSLLQYQSASIIQFLTPDASNNLQDNTYIRKCNALLAKYANPMLSVTSSTQDISLLSDTSSGEQHLNCSYTGLHEAIKRAIRDYIRTGEEIQALDEALQEKLGRLDAAASAMQQLIELDPTGAPAPLTDAIDAYLCNIFEKNAIESTYRAFIEAYGRFTALRSIISLQTEVQKPAGPACTICMTKEVTYAVTPCGHTFCDICSAKQLTACYICRTQIRDRLRIYY